MEESADESLLQPIFEGGQQEVKSERAGQTR